VPEQRRDRDDFRFTATTYTAWLIFKPVQPMAAIEEHGREKSGSGRWSRPINP
jgi:hypothetical protein